MASILGQLSAELGLLYTAIVSREAEAEGVRTALTHCNNDFLALERLRQNLLDNPEPTALVSELIQTIKTVNERLRACREALGSLHEVLAYRDAAKSKRIPRDFGSRHSGAERAIENIQPMIKGLARQLGGGSGSRAQSRRQERSERGSFDTSRGYYQARWGGTDWRRSG